MADERNEALRDDDLPYEPPSIESREQIKGVLGVGFSGLRGGQTN
jgi:hypothetical protein